MRRTTDISFPQTKRQYKQYHDKVVSFEENLAAGHDDFVTPAMCYIRMATLIKTEQSSLPKTYNRDSKPFCD